MATGKMGSHFSQMGSYFAQNTTPNPCSLLHYHTPLSQAFWDVHTQTPPTPPQKHPFSSAWGTSLRKVFYEAFIFSVFSRNQEKVKPLTWRSVSS